MQILNFLTGKKQQKTARRVHVEMKDTYQDSLNQMGKEQFSTMLSKGLSVPIALL